ncbi:gag-asp_proteas domain-containing protein [Cephalotus follicularis]|uniref:Gag-asp_proteas domain-containing protein n=1 Tax=Cephalotus follicularis TaxID=3775 RepID=A0A1Q3AV98_CEPFO|nr:gag-asp_proteas domain-containing protein [Cephalotus follicularis]
MAAADALVDFRMMKSSEGPSSSGKAKPKDKGKQKKDKGIAKKNYDSSGKGRAKVMDDWKEKKVSSGCFICEGLHHARDYPKQGKLNVVVAQSESGGTIDSEAPTRVAPLQLINALRTVPPSDLLYVLMMVQGHQVSAMVDTGATHSFLVERMVDRLSLRVDKHTSQIKAVNSQAQVVAGMAHGLFISMGSWEGKINLMVVPLEFFDLILGNDFISEKVIMMPHLCGLFIMNEKSPNFVAGHNVAAAKSQGDKGKVETLSAMQLVRGLKKGQMTYLASLVEVKSEEAVAAPTEVVGLLEEFKDVMPLELPDGLPPRHGVDHKIELILGSKAPTKAPYRMSPKELAELQNQLNELVVAGKIQPSKAPYGAPVLFKEKQDGSM